MPRVDRYTCVGYSFLSCKGILNSLRRRKDKRPGADRGGLN